MRLKTALLMIFEQSEETRKKRRFAGCALLVLYFAPCFSVDSPWADSDLRVRGWPQPRRTVCLSLRPHYGFEWALFKQRQAD